MSLHVKKPLKLLLCIVLCAGLGFAGISVSKATGGEWYPTLNHPAGTPPAFIYAIAWTSVYVMMGISLWCINKAKAHPTAYFLFFLQLLLNLTLSTVFFGFHHLYLAIAISLIQDIAIIATILTFLTISRPAALLLVPHLMWMLYLSFLNFGLFVYNPYS